MKNIESDLAVDVVSPLSRMPAMALTFAWWSIVSAMFYVFVAATLALGFGTANALVGLGAAVLFYGFIGGMLSRYAIRTGLGCFLLSRMMFGRVGASIATLIFFATAIYYAVFEGSVLVTAAVKIIPGLTYAWACVLIVGYSVPLIAGSVQHWLNRFNGVLLPVYFLGLFGSLFLALHKFGYSHHWLELGPDGGTVDGRCWNCFVAYLGASVLFMFSQDYARFGRLSDVNYHARLNFGYLFYTVAFALNGVIGIFLVGSTQLKGLTEASVVDAFVDVLGGTAALAFVWVSQTRINTANYYVSTVNMQAFFESMFPVRLSKWVWAMLVGSIVLALMLATDVLKYILIALAYQGVFVTAWVGVAIAYVRRNHGVKSSSEDWTNANSGIPAFKWDGLMAWAAGFSSSLVVMHSADAIKSLATPAALVVAALVYLSIGSAKVAKWSGVLRES